MRGVGGDGREEGAVFYSRRLLAKDGPLATVWLAAHFYRKLRKHHVAKASIPSSVDVVLQTEVTIAQLHLHGKDAILQSEVPIALRLLGYLLIGVVRIYAKKVAYVYHECNEALLGIRNSSVSRKGKHYGESSSVSALSFVIPERFELDSFNLEVMEDSVREQVRQEDARAIGANHPLSTTMILYEEGSSDNHRGFSLSWDVFSPEDAGIDLEATYLHRLSDAEASLERLLDHGSPQKAISDTEVLCHSIIPLEDFQIYNELENDAIKLCLNKNLDTDPVNTSLTASEEHHHLSNYEARGSKLIERQIPYEDHVIPDKTCDIVVDKFDKSIMELDVCQVQPAEKASTSIPESTFSPSPAGSSIIPKSVITPEFLLVPTPRKDESRAPRKRKHSVDGSIVLSNEFIRKGLHNANDLVRKRKKILSAVLDVWNAHKNLVLQHNFLEPINPYMSPEFKAVFQQVYLHHKDKDRVEVEAGLTTKSAMVFTDEPSESHRLLSNEALNDQLDPSPEQNLETVNGMIFETSPQCPREAEPQICESSTDAYSLSCKTCSYPEDLSKSPRTPTKNKEARSMHSSVTPELESQAGSSEIVFDLSDEVLFSFEDCQNQDWWSNRTRVVARCLENNFEHQIQQKDVASLSLAKLANKRSRRTCARLFYEILVLKSSGHIDVKQHSPYDDIFLLATPAMKSVS